MSHGVAQTPFLMGSDFVQRRNVAWRVELGRQDDRNPLVEPRTPWDSGHPFIHGTVLRDPIDGLWKAWGTSSPEEGPPMQARRLTFFESEDGVDWCRPELGLHAYGDHKRTNIVFDLESGGSAAYASVLVDADAPRDRRYEMFILRRPGEPEHADGHNVVRGFKGPDGNEPTEHGIYRYYSGDGLRWTPDTGPILINDSDILRPDGTSDGIFIYREPDGSYVCYHKTSIKGFPGGIIPYELGPGVCRVLVRRTSEDGVTWTRHEPCMMPDWRDSADTQFMEIAVTPTAGGYVGVVTVYHASTQTLELQFAASRDGRYWWRPDRRACVSLPPLGDYGGGMMWGSHHMVADGDYLHYYYTGLQGIHGDMLSTEEADLARSEGRKPRELEPLHGESFSRLPGLLTFHGALCRSTWRKDRLWGLTTASGGAAEGTATTRAGMRAGESLRISASTDDSGVILAELVDGDGNVAPGFCRDQCDGFLGDAYRATMTWRGVAECPADGLKVRFVLRRARLYGFDFGSTGCASV